MQVTKRSRRKISIRLIKRAILKQETILLIGNDFVLLPISTNIMMR